MKLAIYRRLGPQRCAGCVKLRKYHPQGVHATPEIAAVSLFVPSFVVEL